MKIIVVVIMFSVIFVGYLLTKDTYTNTVEQWDCSQDVHGINISCPSAANKSIYVGDTPSFSNADSKAVSANDAASAKYVPEDGARETESNAVSFADGHSGDARANANYDEDFGCGTYAWTDKEATCVDQNSENQNMQILRQNKKAE